MAPARLALCVALTLLATPVTAAAADVRQGGTITVPADVTLEDDLYAFGDTISILGTVHGDVVATGVNNVNVDGTVTGDVIPAANSVTIRGQVGGSVRAAGRTVVIDGKIGTDLVVAGNEVTLLLNGRVGRDVYVASSSFTQTGEIVRDLRAGTSTTTIDGHIGGRAQVDADTLRLTPRALVDGPLQYTSPKEAERARGAGVRGQVARHEPQGQPAAAGPAGLLVDALRRGIGLLVLGLFLVFLFPGFSRRAGETLVRAPLRSLLVGLGVLIGLPILAALIFIAGAFVGAWWLGLALLASYLAAFAASIPVSALGVGASILRVTRRPALPALALIVGLIVLLLVGLVPILGSVFLAVAALLGLGATSQAVAGGRRQDRPAEQPSTV